MKVLSGEIAIFIAVVLLVGTPVMMAEPNALEDRGASVETEITAWVIPCKDMVDNGLYESIKRRTTEALDGGAEYLIYEIDTYGGDLFAAFDISNYFLHEVNSKAHTVAYVSKKAISAGAMTSVACEDIIMKENTTIGDCAPIQMGAKLEGVEREKVETITRAAFVNSAKANGYPEALLKAMVTLQLEVYRVKNIQTGTYEFFETVQLPKDVNEYDLGNKQLVVKDDELLTLTSFQAVEYGVARAEVKDMKGALEFLAKRDGVRFADEPIVLETTWSEDMVRWVNSPTVMGILVMVAMLAVYMELNTPGIGLPGLVAVICFTVIIGSKYLTGMANWLEVALFITGLLLLTVEVFILPGFGIAGMLGITCILSGLFGMLIKNPPDEIPWPQTQLDWKLFSDGALGISFGFIGFIVLAWVIGKYLPKLEFLSGLILVPTAAKQRADMKVSMTILPESKVSAVNIGDVGEVTSTLRPIGKARFGDAIVDVVAEAEFLDKGVKVEIIEIHGNRVVVKAALS
jgi:membrane-bound serine protease (ClpP class)